MSTNLQQEKLENTSLSTQEVFTDKEAAAYLRTSQVTLWRERRKGRITFRRVSSKIIYLRQDLEAYLDQNKRNA